MNLHHDKLKFKMIFIQHYCFGGQNLMISYIILNNCKITGTYQKFSQSIICPLSLYTLYLFIIGRNIYFGK